MLEGMESGASGRALRGRADQTTVAALVAFSRAACTAVMVVGAAVLLGWLLDVQALKSLHPSHPAYAAMKKAVTAITRYAPSSWAPSSQFDSPSREVTATMSVASATIPISNGVNTNRTCRGR